MSLPVQGPDTNQTRSCHSRSRLCVPDASRTAARHVVPARRWVNPGHHAKRHCHPRCIRRPKRASPRSRCCGRLGLCRHHGWAHRSVGPRHREDSPRLAPYRWTTGRNEPSQRRAMGLRPGLQSAPNSAQPHGHPGGASISLGAPLARGRLRARHRPRGRHMPPRRARLGIRGLPVRTLERAHPVDRLRLVAMPCPVPTSAWSRWL